MMLQTGMLSPLHTASLSHGQNRAGFFAFTNVHILIRRMPSQEDPRVVLMLDKGKIVYGNKASVVFFNLA